MRATLNSGYSDKDSSIVFVRDGAFATADPGDPLMVWDNEGDFENNGNEFGYFKKEHLQPLEEAAVVVNDYTDDTDNETITESPINITKDEPQANSDDFRIGDTVIVKVRGQVTALDEKFAEIEFIEDTASGDSQYLMLLYANPNFVDIKLDHRNIQHPAVGTLVVLNTTNRNTQPYGPGEYVLGVDNYYYGVDSFTAGKKVHKDNPDIARVKVIQT